MHYFILHTTLDYRERAHHFDFRERDHFVYDRERERERAHHFDFRGRDHFVYDRERDAYAWKIIVYVVLTLILLEQVLPDDRH